MLPPPQKKQLTAPTNRLLKESNFTSKKNLSRCETDSKEWFMIFFLIHKVTMGFAVIGVINGVLMQVWGGSFLVRKSILIEKSQLLIRCFGALLLLLILGDFCPIMRKIRWICFAWTFSEISITDTSN